MTLFEQVSGQRSHTVPEVKEAVDTAVKEADELRRQVSMQADRACETAVARMDRPDEVREENLESRIQTAEIPERPVQRVSARERLAEKIQSMDGPGEDMSRDVEFD